MYKYTRSVAHLSVHHNIWTLVHADVRITQEPSRVLGQVSVQGAARVQSTAGLLVRQPLRDVRTSHHLWDVIPVFLACRHTFILTVIESENSFILKRFLCSRGAAKSI